MNTTVRITNTYADRESVDIWQVPSPADTSSETVADWWDDVVFPLTGDGRGGYAVSEATVESSDLPELVGQTTEWEG